MGLVIPQEEDTIVILIDTAEAHCKGPNNPFPEATFAPLNQLRIHKDFFRKSSTNTDPRR